MADDIAITAGVGTNVATDDVGGRHFQRIKLCLGADGAATDLGLGQAAMAASMPVVLASDQSVVLVAQSGIVVAQTPTVTAGAYSAGDAVGGKLTFANAVRASGGSARVVSVVIADKNKQNVELELWLFNQDFTPTADNAAFAVSSSDLLNCVGVVRINTSDYASASANGVATVPVGDLLVEASGGSTLYGQLKCVGAPTYASTSDIGVKVGFEYRD